MVNQSIVKAWGIVTLISESTVPMETMEIAEKLNMNRTTTIRFLQTLESLSLLRRTASGYTLGLAFFSLGKKVSAGQVISDRIHPYLVKYAQAMNETINLAIMVDHKAVSITKVDSSRSLRTHVILGLKMPIHACSVGKAMLSALPAEQSDLIIRQLKLERLTPNTIVSVQQLKKELDQIRQHGFSIGNQELEVDLMGVGMPFSVPQFDFKGAISFAGPSGRFSGDRIKELATQLARLIKELNDEFSI